MKINEVSREIHQNAVNKGFWDDNFNVSEKLMLTVSELSEAQEADRKGHRANVGAFIGWINPTLNMSYEDWNAKAAISFEKTIKNSFEDEWLMLLSESLTLPIKWVLIWKGTFN